MPLDTLDTPPNGSGRRAIAVMVLSFTMPALVSAWAASASAQDFNTALRPVEMDPAETDPVEMDLHAPRLRFGVSGVGGGFAGVVDGGAVGLAPRIGVQLDDVVGIYVQTHALIGNFYPTSTANRVAGFLYNALMFDFTALDGLQFGLGPSLDFSWNCRLDANHRDPCGNGAARLGGNFRIAIVLGTEAHRASSREGVVLSLEVHPTWQDPDFTTMMLLGLGGEMY